MLHQSTSNAVHGSDSDENAQMRGSFFFSQFRRFLKVNSIKIKKRLKAAFFLFGKILTRPFFRNGEPNNKEYS
jgi:hypothetical protein